MYKEFEVKLKIHRVDGGIPADSNVIVDWLSANGIQDDEELAAKIAANTISEEDLDAKLRKVTTTFIQNELGRPCLESRCFKATLLNAANTMGLFGTIPGLRELMRQGSEVRPELIPLAASSAELKTYTRVVHVISPTGQPLGGFKRVRYLENVLCEFKFLTLDRIAIAQEFGTKKDGKVAVPRKTAVITKELLKAILIHAGTCIGFGANRSQGVGKAELLELREIN
jgi:hypothetical protein